MRVGLAALLTVLTTHFCVAAVHEISVISYLEGSIQTVPLRSTERLPEASGTVKVERKGGTTEIQLELESMKPASLFGGDYNTYVLWVVPPGGRAENLGEVQLTGTRGNLRATTRARTFAILVSAEPHYLTSAPSAFLLLQNNSSEGAPTIQQPLVEGVYNFARSTLDGVKAARGTVHSDVKQAFTAVRLAQRAGAQTLANAAFVEAQHALDETLALWKERRDRTEITAQAREAIRLAVVAQRLAQERALQGPQKRTEGSGGGMREPEERAAQASR
jgi:hypothetical protein